MPRKTGKIRSNKTFLVVVEGEKTEYLYFSEMKALEKIPGLTIKIKKAKHSSPYYILSTALEEQKNEKQYESIWCIYDCDVIAGSDTVEKNIEKLKAKVLKKGIFIADSLPSFEIWFLLHYTIPRKYYKNQEELIEELRDEKYFPDYKKEKSNVYSKLKDLTNRAIENSHILATRNNKDEYDKDASFCNVYKIVEELISIKNIQR